MRQSLEHLPGISRNGSNKPSPVRFIQMRNPFDQLIATGSIRPICHRSPRNKSPCVLPSLPKPMNCIKKVKSEKYYKEKIEFFKQASNSPRRPRKETQRVKSPHLIDKLERFKDVTFGIEDI